MHLLPLPSAYCPLFLAMRRPERVADIIREEISQIVGYELEDPRLTMVTVTDVRLSTIAGMLRFYVRLREMKKNTGSRLRLSATPRPTFASNWSFAQPAAHTRDSFCERQVEEHGERVDQLLQELALEWESEERMNRMRIEAD